VAGVCGALLALGTAAFGAGGVLTVPGIATLKGTSDPAPGVSIQTSTVWNDRLADTRTVTTGADGTFTLDFAYATGYSMQVLTTGGYAQGFGWISALPGASITCHADAALAGANQYSDLGCDQVQDTSDTHVFRFWSPRFNNAHFFTTSYTEAANIERNDPNWISEGTAFRGLAANGESCDLGQPVYRFYSAAFQSHFYTQSAAEKAHIVANDRSWRYEGVAYCAYTEALPGTVPLYRFWSPGFGKHFFTANQAEAEHSRAVDRNWTYEGVAYYVLP
jgi:hypothetical protein